MENLEKHIFKFENALPDGIFIVAVNITIPEGPSAFSAKSLKLYSPDCRSVTLAMYEPLLSLLLLSDSSTVLFVDQVSARASFTSILNVWGYPPLKLFSQANINIPCVCSISLNFVGAIGLPELR